MANKFHILQDMLYPKSEKMAKQFILDAVGINCVCASQPPHTCICEYVFQNLDIYNSLLS